jgi:hypothetical protein
LLIFLQKVIERWKKLSQPRIGLEHSSEVNLSLADSQELRHAAGSLPMAMHAIDPRKLLICKNRLQQFEKAIILFDQSRPKVVFPFNPGEKASVILGLRSMELPKRVRLFDEGRAMLAIHHIDAISVVAIEGIKVGPLGLRQYEHLRITSNLLWRDSLRNLNHDLSAQVLPARLRIHVDACLLSET